ncbi:MFS general substrate transporter [Flagelloscypha sp. PMI_526]|nr:MFS general substrate transporter [Flagelloscypha sp. PMI_526]
MSESVPDSPVKSDIKGKEINAVTETVYEAEESDSLDPVYQAKAKILNNAIQEIGMGSYQWGLFVVTGFGWRLILPSVLNEFAGFKGPYLKLGQNVGLLVGAVFWGVGSDIWGRKVSFNITLLITGVFALAAGGSPNSTALSSFAAVWSIGVGGNLPVDSAIFLEFVPASHQYLLTVLSIWWAFGQLIGSLLAWPLIGSSKFSCPTAAKGDTSYVCHKADNMGWRYFIFLMGGLMIVLWGIRFFLFKLYESPKFLMTVEVVHILAKKNGKESHLALEDLEAVSGGEKADAKAGTKATDAVKRQLRKFETGKVKSLFATRKLALSTSLLIAIWALIGLAFPLYNAFVTYFLATRGADFGDGSVYITYRNQVILSVIGVPGALLAGYLVELPLLGRRGTLALSTVLTGVFILVSTTARSSASLLGWNCAYSFTSNVAYGALYAMPTGVRSCSPPASRGTGNAIVAAANRIFGIMAPIIALYADLTTSVPIFISGAIFIAAGLLALLLPFEPRGKAAL